MYQYYSCCNVAYESVFIEIICDVLFLVFATLKVQVVIQEYYIELVEELEGQMKLHQIRRIDAAAA